MSTLFVFFLALSLFFSRAEAFTFTFGTPTQCDPLPISWTGTPPFQLILIPVFGTPRNISIPASAFNGGKGSFSVPLPVVKGSQVLLTMSDATGFNTGGTTTALTVGASKGGSCDTTDPGIAFPFQLNSALQQCRPFVFSGYDTAIQPVTITGIVPGGTSFILNPPNGPNSFTWNANVAQGTSMLFFMTDAQGRQGGSSDIRLVAFSDDTSCLNNLSPSSTSAAPSATGSTTPTSTSTAAPTTTAPPSNGLSIAAIAGTVIGALLFLAVIVTLGLFFLRKKRDARSSTGNNVRRYSHRIDSEVDLSYDPSQAGIVTPYGLPHGLPPNHSVPASPYPPYSPDSNRPFDPSPFLDNSPPPSQYQSSQYQTSIYQSPPTQHQHPGAYQPPSQYQDPGAYQPPSQYQNPGPYQPPAQYYPPQSNYAPSNAGPDPFGAPGPPTLPTGAEYESYPLQGQSQTQSPEQSTSRDSMATGTSAAQRKAAMAGNTSYKPSRFVMHTDADDDLPPPNEDGVVELPPQYSERHGALGVTNPSPSPGPNAGHPPGPGPYRS
ncbi:hypothetical protein B0H34DRAFT_49886 [Crassisporium funariophilum]|nr:hypothetical protein B0H34DRAFT_49886 [Crassisporium funariophilum]